jgi:hypothetical protein
LGLAEPTERGLWYPFTGAVRDGQPALVVNYIITRRTSDVCAQKGSWRPRAGSGLTQRPRSKLDGVLEPGVTEVAIENRWTERFFVNPSADEYLAERREQELVLQLEAHLRRQGHDAVRFKTSPQETLRRASTP